MWIPDPDFFSITLECDLPATAKVGEWVTLDASRWSGPWQCVEESQIPEGVIPFPEPPEEYEEHVAPNVHWKIEPETVRFHAPTLDTLDFDTKYRKVVFLRPGSYRVRAITAFPAREESEWYTIDVTE